MIPHKTSHLILDHAIKQSILISIPLFLFQIRFRIVCKYCIEQYRFVVSKNVDMNQTWQLTFVGLVHLQQINTKGKHYIHSIDPINWNHHNPLATFVTIKI